ncbi:helitron_like_N domain-containing protein [Trichonephila clavipes]|nr:helitron_like_N domain-containing protein [Trichonephila clavipes]
MNFIGDDKNELDARCKISTGVKRRIVSQLQELLHEKNHLVCLFKTATDMMPSDTHKIVIRADKTPAGEHVRRFHALTEDEVAIIIVLAVHHICMSMLKMQLHMFRLYGCPDLFISFTCNPAWDDNQQLLLPGHMPVDRHDVTACVFRQKLKSLMDFMIDDVTCAEIPDINIDKDLHEVVVKNMIHGPCGTFNPNSPCMIDGKCSKRYPRALISNTITGTDGYPLCRRRSAEEGGKSATIKMQNRGIKVDNQ